MEAPGKEFPVKSFGLIVGLVCLGMAASAIHTYWTLGILRLEYVQGRGREITSGLEGQVRGPGRLADPVPWERLFSEKLASNDSGIAFLALFDRSGQLFADAGNAEPRLITGSQVGFVDNLFVYEQELPRGRHEPPGTSQTGGFPRIRVGLRTSYADLLLRQARIHLLITAVGLVLLISLSVCLVRIVNRLVQLRVRQEAERHLTNLGRMSAMLAHEIRNPLGAMKGLVQVAKERLPADHSTHTLLETVVVEARRLEELVKDLLLFARPKGLTLSRFDLSALIRDVIAFLTPRAEESKVEMSGPVPPESAEVNSDKDALRQVLMNVILNAIQANPEGGRVTVGVKRTGRRQCIEVEVCDEGPGLGDGDAEDLFQPFKTTKSQGSGLGLAISRQLIERLNGRILLFDQESGGACCRFEVPADSTV